ncbi:UTRA domain-containing protein [Streptomyces sp. NPDC051597]|uniref:GntR family transcriptional regulator n=1 Tax=Streptomyces sp. NPDC051597 TaxID=3155049 RepID=UPI003447653F
MATVSLFAKSSKVASMCEPLRGTRLNVESSKVRSRLGREQHVSSDRWSSSSTQYVAPRSPIEAEAWSAEAEARGGKGSQRLIEVAEVPPPPEIAHALALGAGETVITRRRMMYLDDRPVELTNSYFPLSIARDTALAESAKIRGGAVTLLASLGYTAKHVTEEVYSRPPTPHEQVSLQLPDGQWVLILARTSRDAEGTPFEADLMVMPAQQNRLVYEMDR